MLSLYGFNIVDYFSVLLVISGLGYFIIVMVLFCVLRKVRTGFSKKKPFVSVVIAARNESASIGSCLRALQKQDYPTDLFEVIVVDDRSEDETADVLAHFQSDWKNMKVIKVDRVPEDVSPKKNALSKAIDHSSGEIILQTDADCIVPETWISGMVSCFEESVSMVTGVAPYFTGSGTLNSFIRHEYLWNVTLSAGSIALGHGTHATGRNLGFRRQVFNSIGGYGSSKTVLSGDDTLLLHRIQKIRKKGVATMPDKSTHVYTRAPEDLKSFVQQRIRHMSTGKYFDPVLIGIGVIVYSYHILTIASLLFSIVSLHALSLFVFSFIWKNAVDSIAALRAKTVFGLNVQWRRFIINEFFLLVYMTVMPVAGLFFPVKWKEN